MEETPALPSPTPSSCSPLQFRARHCSLAPTSRTRFWIARTAPHLRSSNGGQPQPEDQDLQDPDVLETWDLFGLNMHICMLWVCLSRAKGLLTVRNLNLTWLRCLSVYVPKTTLSLATPWGVTEGVLCDVPANLLFWGRDEDGGTGSCSPGTGFTFSKSLTLFSGAVLPGCF